LRDSREARALLASLPAPEPCIREVPASFEGTLRARPTALDPETSAASRAPPWWMRTWRRD